MTPYDTSEIARSRAERYLARAVVQASIPDDAPFPGQDSRAMEAQRRTTLDAALQVYVALGLIDDTAAREWGKLADVTRTLGPAVTTSSRVNRLLAERVEKVPPTPGERADAIATMGAGPYGDFMAAFNAAMALGELSRRDAADWQERLMGQVLHGQETALEEVRTRRSVQFAQLERVLPGPAHRRSGLVFVCVEVYRDAALLCCQRPYEPATEVAKPGERPQVPEPLDAKVADDLRTDYTTWGAGGESQPASRWTQRTIVAPAPPPAARTLSVSLDGEEFTVDLHPASNEIAIR